MFTRSNRIVLSLGCSVWGGTRMFHCTKQELNPKQGLSTKVKKQNFLIVNYGPLVGTKSSLHATFEGHSFLCSEGGFSLTEKPSLDHLEIYGLSNVRVQNGFEPVSSAGSPTLDTVPVSVAPNVSTDIVFDFIILFKSPTNYENEALIKLLSSVLDRNGIFLAETPLQTPEPYLKPFTLMETVNVAIVNDAQLYPPDEYSQDGYPIVEAPLLTKPGLRCYRKWDTVVPNKFN